ncbi:Crp/Fnr family transcriptional regulator [Bernardetia sp. MNP-M8]|uniref:Crp/Fnr family transcriptional regulator n=1 Tax=Bernardetia sp. MNP-M8 TaxID=3127470 RepID=UPI0030D0D276
MKKPISFTQFLCSIVNFSETELELFTSLFEKEKMSNKHFFAKKGEYSKQVAFVETGILRAFYSNEKGEEYNKTFFTSNQFVGAYSSLVSQKQNSIDIQCLTDCVLWVASFESVIRLYDDYHKIERLSRLLAEQFFVNKEKREIELVTLEAKQRYQIFLEEHKGLENQIAQYHIASYLGITPTQLSRIRSRKE